MKKIFALVLGFFLMGANTYAGNGDLIVNGNVGVGTTPATKLHVNGGSGTILSVAGGGGGDPSQGGQIKLTTTSSGATNPDKYIRVNTDGSLQIINSSYTAALLSIKDTGYTGIGISPSSTYKLTIAGSGLASGGVWSDSDIKFKKDVQQIDGALDKVQKLTGVSYLYKTDEYKDKGFPEGKRLGVIAQELEKVIPEAVMTDEEGSKAVNYSMIIPVLIEAIKAQQEEIEELKGKVK